MNKELANELKNMIEEIKKDILYKQYQIDLLEEKIENN